MAEEKKFIDQKGVEYLWSQLSLEDYPNNEVLMAVLNAIDETKADKSEIPTKISALENDSNFINSSALDSYYNKIEVDAFHGTLEDYVDNQVAALVNAAPETLDTLGELATAIEEHQDVTDALDAAITNKADKTTTETAIADLQSKDNSFEATFALLNPEIWTFTLTDGSTVSKQVVLYTK